MLDVPFDMVMGLADRYKAGPGLYYMLSIIDMIHGKELHPDWPLQDLVRRTDRKFDFGWQIGKLFMEIDPAPVDLFRICGH
jgi:hypothetical protein